MRTIEVEIENDVRSADVRRREQREAWRSNAWRSSGVCGGLMSLDDAGSALCQHFGEGAFDADSKVLELGGI